MLNKDNLKVGMCITYSTWLHGDYVKVVWLGSTKFVGTTETGTERMYNYDTLEDAYEYVKIQYVKWYRPKFVWNKYDDRPFICNSFYKSKEVAKQAYSDSRLLDDDKYWDIIEAPEKKEDW